MPQSNEPIKKRPKVEDESIGEPPAEKTGKHRERDEALPGRGGSKGGLDKESGVDRGTPTKGTKQSRD